MLSNIETQYAFVTDIHNLSYKLWNNYSILNAMDKKRRFNELRSTIDKLEFFIENGEENANT